MRLAYTTPFDWQRLLGFFAVRATPGVERVVGDAYQRTLLVGGVPSVIEVKPDARPGHLAMSLLRGATRADRQTLRSAADFFDLDAPLAAISEALSRDRRLRALLKAHPGVRVPGAWSGFELTIRAILGQQISVKAATTIAGRIARRYGEPLQGDAGDDSGLDRLFPTPERLSRARFNGIGIVRSRAATLRSLSTAVLRGDLVFDARDPAATREALKSIKGIGEWTAQYVAMRALREADAFPGSDLGLVSAIDHPERVTPNALLARAEQWRPWRAYAALLLWSSLPGSGG